MKDRLVELLLEIDSVCEVGECNECSMEACFIHRAADHLIANGLTFAPDNNVGGEISLIKRVKYAGDIHTALLKLGWDIGTAAAFLEGIPDAPHIEQPEWIPVSERLPDCEWGAECPEPVFYKMKDTGKVYAGYYGTGGVWRDRYFRQYGTSSVDIDDVACWMYQSALPELPKEEV